MPPQRLAVQLMLAQAVLFAGETAAVHQIGARMPVMQLALLRASGGLVLALVLAWKSGLGVVRTGQLGLQLLRGTVSLIYLWVMMYSFAHMPLADATAVSYTQSAYITAFSALILGETVTGGRWFAATIGLIGALMMAKPEFGNLNFVYLVVLGGTSFNGLAFVLNRYLQQKDSESTTMFYSNLVPLLGCTPALLFTGLPPADLIFWLPGLVVLGPLGMLAGIVAVRLSTASALGPFTLLRLVIGMVAGTLAFNELPDIYSILGAGLIIASCVLPISTSGAPWRRRLPSLLSPSA